MSNNVGCLCIIDDSTINESYMPWHFAFLKENKLHDCFDVFIASLDEERLKSSELLKFLDSLKLQGVVRHIFTIEFNVNDVQNRQLQQAKLSTLCENFREVNQMIHGLKYSFYYQVAADFKPSVELVSTISSFFGKNVTTDAVFLLKNFDFFGKFMATANRHIFSNVQNFYSFFNAEPSGNIKFLFEKFLVNMNQNVQMIEGEERW